MKNQSTKKRKNYENNKDRKRESEGYFKVLVSEIPCNTTQYETSKKPELGVLNWYQCVEDWRYEWTLDKILDLMDDAEVKIEQQSKIEKNLIENFYPKEHENSVQKNAICSRILSFMKAPNFKEQQKIKH